MSHHDHDVTSWDLFTGHWDGGTTICSPYFETLITGDISLGQTGTGEHTFGGRYVPMSVMTGGLAESWETLEDPLRLVFYLREGIYWQGVPGVMPRREFVADDVVFSYEKRTHHPLWGIEALPTYHDWVDEFVATDKYTVTLMINYLYPDWGVWMGYGGPIPGNIIPEELVDAGIADWRNHVGLGTGPWLLENFVTASSVEYTRNPEHWRTTTIDGVVYDLPFTDKYIHTIIVDEAIRLAALRTGTLDICMKIPWTYSASLAASNPELVEWSADNWDFFEIGPRHDTPPFDQKDVRQAMSMAIDRDYIVDTLYGGYGLKYNWPQPIAWGESVHTPMDQYPAEIQKMYQYHPEDAKEMLTLAGFPDGFKCEVIYGGGETVAPVIADILSLVKDYWWDNLNIELTLVPLDEAAYSAELENKTLKHMMAGFENSPTPCIGIEEWTHPGVYNNVFFWVHPDMLGLRTSYYAATTDAEQASLLKQMEYLIVEDMVSIFLPVPDIMRYSWPWVMNYQGEAMNAYRTSVNLMSIIWIDQDLKAEMGY
ncbi:hypothetical protein ES703_105602 [subsurface metagenome]